MLKKGHKLNLGRKRPDMIGNTLGFIKGQIPWNKDREWPEEVRKKISQSKKGNTKPNKTSFKKGQNPWNKGLTKNIDNRIDYYRPTKIKKGERIGLKTEFKKGEMSEKQLGKRNSNWMGGKSFEPYTLEWTKQLKENIRKRDKNVCQVCKKKQSNKKHPVHHIDYNKINCNLTNLITLCINCHIKTNHNRNYWPKYFYEKFN